MTFSLVWEIKIHMKNTQLSTYAPKNIFPSKTGDTQEGVPQKADFKIPNSLCIKKTLYNPTKHFLFIASGAS